MVSFETMGESSTNRRLKLSGGQQAKRHRAVCNRGHGISPSVTRFRINGNAVSSVRTLTISINEASARRNSNGAVLGGLTSSDNPGLRSRRRRAGKRGSGLTFSDRGVGQQQGQVLLTPAPN